MTRTGHEGEGVGHERVGGGHEKEGLGQESEGAGCSSTRQGAMILPTWTKVGCRFCKYRNKVNA